MNSSCRLLTGVVLALLLSPFSHAGSCRPLSSTQVWNASVKGQLLAGMGASDVRRAWGEPRRIKARAKGRQEWIYRTEKGPRHLYIAADGCLEARSLPNRQRKR